MKRTRVQRRRSTKRKGTRKYRKQQGGQPKPGSVCQSIWHCYYGGYHDWSEDYLIPRADGGYTQAKTCNKCNCTRYNHNWPQAAREW